MDASKFYCPGCEAVLKVSMMACPKCGREISHEERAEAKKRKREAHLQQLGLEGAKPEKNARVQSPIVAMIAVPGLCSFLAAVGAFAIGIPSAKYGLPLMVIGWVFMGIAVVVRKRVVSQAAQDTRK